MTNGKVRIDPEFERFIKNMKKNLKNDLRTIIGPNEINIKNTQVQRIIAKMNKEQAMNIKLKKLKGKRRGFRLVFQ